MKMQTVKQYTKTVIKYQLMDKHPQITKALSNILEQFYKDKGSKVSSINTFKTVKK